MYCDIKTVSIGNTIVLHFNINNVLSSRLTVWVHNLKKIHIRQLSGSRQAVVRQSSDSRQAVVRQSSGSRQAVIRQQLSGSRQAVVR